MMFVPRIWERSCVGVCFACGKILHGLLIQGDTLASIGSLGGASLSILLQAKCHYPLCQASSASCKCLETPGEESRDGLSHSLVATVFWQDFTSQSKGLPSHVSRGCPLARKFYQSKQRASHVSRGCPHYLGQSCLSLALETGGPWSNDEGHIFPQGHLSG